MRPAPLTVAELVGQLAAFPADALVMVDGYELGIDNAAPPQIVYAIREDWVTKDNSTFGRYTGYSPPYNALLRIQDRVVVLISRG